MKFNTLKDFWEWLTISTGNLETDYLALCAYLNSEDEKLLNNIKYRMLNSYMEIIKSLYTEQRERESL